MTRKGFLVIALAAALMGGCNRTDRRETAANPNNPAGGAVGTAGASDVTRGDKDFIHDVAIANAAEIDLGRMASERAADPQVKKFGQMMVQDHTIAGEKLKAIASQKGIDWPDPSADKDRDKRDDLAKKQAADFDRAYIEHMVDAHKDLVDKLESRIDKNNLSQWKASMDERRGGKTVPERGQAVEIVPEKSDDAVTMRINEWAAATYPTAYGHLQTARTLDDAVKRRHTTQ